MATEDAAVLLADFVSSLDNLPSEVHHILQEIGHKEAKSHDFLHRGTSRDQAIQKFGRPQSQGGMGLIAVNPKEEASIAKIRMEFSRAEDLARDKVALSERGVALLARHLTRLTAQLESLTPNVPPLPTLPTYAPAPVAPTPAAPYNQSYSTPQPAQQQQQYHSASYQAGAYGMGTGSTNMGAPGSQGAHAYGTSIDKNGQYTSLHQQQQQNGQHAHQNGYPYSSPASQSGSAARGARPSRLATVYPIPQGNGQHSPHNANQLAQQQHQHLQAQQIQLQQQQQQQQMLRQQQQQQLLQQQQQQQHNHHQAHSSGTKQRRRNTEGEAEEEADEGEADGEDQTPYCFCQRPSFGEMIGCDAPDCAIEWFHLSCVGLKSTPEGSWYCTSCEPKVSKLGPGGGRGGRRK